MFLTNQLSLKCSEYEDLGTEIFTFTLLAISLVTRFTGTDERPLSVFTQQISVTVIGISSDSGPFRSRPIRAQQKLSRPIRIAHLGQVTPLTSQMPIYGHGCSRDPMG